MKRDFQLAPPKYIAYRLYSPSRDINGNSTSHIQLYWSNNKTGEDYQFGSYNTKRRVQTTYSGCSSDAAIILAEQLFYLVEYHLQEKQDDNSGTLVLHDYIYPVIFRKLKKTQEIIAVLPTYIRCLNVEKMFVCGLSHDNAITHAQYLKHTRSVDFHDENDMHKVYLLRNKLKDMYINTTDVKTVKSIYHEIRKHRFELLSS